MIPLRLVGVPTMMLLAICLLLGLAAAAPLPGVAWSKLEIWEGSAAADVWLYAAEYLDFRKYVKRPDPSLVSGTLKTVIAPATLCPGRAKTTRGSRDRPEYVCIV